VTRLLREPLLHFFLGGAVLFVAGDGLGNERLWSAKPGARAATLIGDPLRERLR